MPGARRSAAMLGVFAVLFQALVSAWHHHALTFSWQEPPAIAAPAPGGETPATAHRDCQICFVLGHHGAVPVDLFAAASAEPAPLRRSPAPEPMAASAAYTLFRSRAPPEA